MDAVDHCGLSYAKMLEEILEDKANYITRRRSLGVLVSDHNRAHSEAITAADGCCSLNVFSTITKCRLVDRAGLAAFSRPEQVPK